MQSAQGLMMTPAQLNLPIGIQTFREIRDGGYYYVDKTPFALQLLERRGKYYFLSRPRRFGKSLFLDTLHELLAGQKDLFTGLYAEEHWDWSVQYPVIRLDLSAGLQQDIAEIAENLVPQVAAVEERYGLEVRFPAIRSRLRDLIIRLHQQTGNRVVLLVDEYDQPILSQLHNPALAAQARDMLRSLYSLIKECDGHIRFAFLTGVSQFSKVSIFSGINSLRDITLVPQYSAICGYTDTDIDTVFAPELPGLDREEIRRWYNGYNWDGESVYNPFDLLLLFQERRFQSFWFETGTPTFLTKLLRERQTWVPALEGYRIDKLRLTRFDVDRIQPEVLLFQSGYLTVRSVTEVSGDWIYELGYPNREVYQSLNQALLEELLPSPESADPNQRLRLRQVLENGDLNELGDLFGSILAGIPNDWYRRTQLANYEGFYATVVYCYFAALGLDVRAEDVTSRGRIDLTVRAGGRIVLFEFKVVEQSGMGRAIEQIRTRDYAAKYRQYGQPIWLVGMEFSRESRSIVGLDVEQDQA